MKINQWKRINPYFKLELDMRILMRNFDGDYAVEDEFHERERFTINQVIDITDRYKKMIDKKKKEEEDLKDFESKFSSGEIVINLKDLNNTYFCNSEHYEEFIRVSHEIYKKQLL